MSESTLPQQSTDPAVLAARRAAHPLGAALTWEALERTDGVELLDRLRDQDPVSWCDAVGGWLVTSRDLVQQVYRQPRVFTVDAEANLVRAVLGETMLAVDGERHKRMRSPFNPTFKYSAVRDRFGEVVAGHVDRIADRLEAQGGAELCADFAAPFATAMAAELLGLELDRIDDLRETYELFARGMNAYDDPDTLDAAVQARDRLSGGLGEQLVAARRAGRSTLLAEVTSGQGLTDEEAIADARVIMFGAIETVEAMIVNSLWMLLTHDTARAEVEGDRELLDSAIDEALRILPPVGFVERWATEDTALGDVEIAAGDFVVPVLTAANRDPAHFEEPARYDLHRENVRHSVSFSQGVHHCLGVNLARLEGAITLGRMLDRWPRLRLDPARPSEPRGFASRRMPELHVLWS